MDLSAEDLTMGRHGGQVAPDDDDDDHDDHDDNDKINDAEGVDPERLKAFNVSQRQCFGSDLRLCPPSCPHRDQLHIPLYS